MIKIVDKGIFRAVASRESPKTAHLKNSGFRNPRDPKINSYSLKLFLDKHDRAQPKKRVLSDESSWFFNRNKIIIIGCICALIIGLSCGAFWYSGVLQTQDNSASLKPNPNPPKKPSHVSSKKSMKKPQERTTPSETPEPQEPASSPKSYPVPPPSSSKKSTEPQKRKTPETPKNQPKAKKSQILVFTSYTTDNPQRLKLSKLSAENHREYCQRHGYKYIAVEKNMAEPALPYWTKIKGLLRFANDPSKPKWLMWVDDDIVFTNPKAKLTDVIERLDNGETHIVVTQDAESYRNPQIPLNTGVLIVKNTPESRKILEDIWAMRNQFVRGKGYTYGNCPDQICLYEQQALSEYIAVNSKAAKHVKIIPQRSEVGAINTFKREPHYDSNRNDLYLAYSDPESHQWHEGDFMGQCTGMSTYGYTSDNRVSKNLREDCIKTLIAASKIALSYIL